MTQRRDAAATLIPGVNRPDGVIIRAVPGANQLDGTVIRAVPGANPLDSAVIRAILDAIRANKTAIALAKPHF